jgi:hypothetical protein
MRRAIDHGGGLGHEHARVRDRPDEAAQKHQPARIDEIGKVADGAPERAGHEPGLHSQGEPRRLRR